MICVHMQPQENNSNTTIQLQSQRRLPTTPLAFRPRNAMTTTPIQNGPRNARSSLISPSPSSSSSSSSVRSRIPSPRMTPSDRSYKHMPFSQLSFPESCTQLYVGKSCWRENIRAGCDGSEFSLARTAAMSISSNSSTRRRLKVTLHSKQRPQPLHDNSLLPGNLRLRRPNPTTTNPIAPSSQS